MAGDEELADAFGSRATGHDSTNRGHRGRERMRVNSPRPRKQPEVTVEAVVAMAGGVELTGACETIPRGHETLN